MGTMVYNVIKRWKSTEDIQIILYVPEKLDSDYLELLRKNGIVVQELRSTNYFVWEQYVLPKAVKEDHIDILWCPYNTAPLFCRCKTVVTIHDVIYLTEKLSTASTLYKKAGMLYRRLVVPRAARNAETIITDSEFSKKEIKENIKQLKASINVIYIGMDNTLSRLHDEKSFFEKHGINRPYILGFGSLEKRKNSMRLIQAYEALDAKIKNNIQLVLFGFRGYEQSEEYRYIQERNLDNVVVLGYITEEEKNTLYVNSEMFVFPSLSEGFGIPVLEAFSNQTPVITSNVTSIPEVAGNAAVMVNPESVSEITRGIKMILENSELSENMVSKGRRQLSKFHWSKAAEEIMESILGVT